MSKETLIALQKNFWEDSNKKTEGLFEKLASELNPFLLYCLKWIKEKSSVLEIGASFGRDARYLDVNKECEVVAMDIALSPLIKLVEFSSEDGSNSTFPLVAYMRNIPFNQKQKFDVLYSRSSLHLSDDELVEFLSKILPMLSDNAKIIIQGKSEKDGDIKKSEPIDENLVIDADKHIRRSWEKKSSLRIFSDFGLKLIESGETKEFWREKETTYIHFILEKE